MSVAMAIADEDHTGLDGRSISVVGDSAGGGLAAAVALKWRQTGRQSLRSQVLLVPMLQTVSFDLQSFKEESHIGSEVNSFLAFASYYRWGDMKLSGELLSKSPTLLPRQTWVNVARRLAGEDVDIEMPPAEGFPHAARILSEEMSPLLAASVKDVAPTLIISAGLDVLRTEGEAYERRLKLAGVAVHRVLYADEVHAFVAALKLDDSSSPVHRPNAEDSLEKTAQFLKEHA